MAAWTTRLGSNIKNVDPRLRDIMEKAAVQFAQENPGYSVIGISGKKGRKSGTKQHPAGWAIDVDIVDQTGKHLGNFRDATSLRTYEKFGQIARAYQKGNYPELTRDFRAGMYFGGGWWGDQMHFDINPEKRGAMSFGSWEDGLNEAGVKAYNRFNKTNMKKADLSIGMNAFPEAPSGPTGWPTPTEKGPGIYGALNPVTRAQQYAAAGNRRAYEQGFRPGSAATPLDQFTPAPAVTPPAAAQTPVAFGNVPMASGMPENAAGIGPQSRAVLGPLGAVTPGMYGETPTVAAVPQPVAPTQARVGTPAAPAMNISATAPVASQLASPSEALRVGAPSVPSLAPSAPFSPAGPYATAAAPAAPAPLSREISPTTQAKIDAVEAAYPSYPDESRFSMKKGLTPADMVQMGLTPAPALVQRPAVKEAPVKETPQQETPQQETIATTPIQTVAAPTIAPAAPPPAKPAGLIGALENLVSPLAKPFHTLANLAGPVPNPPSRNIGTGSEAISGILSGLGQPGDTAYSRSMRGYSVRDLGNGMVEKTNQYGVKSYERVDKPGGIFTSNPGGLYSAHPSGLLSGFGLGGAPSTVGGLFSGRNLGSFAGSLLGGAVAGPFGALAGGWLGNKLGSNLGTAPTASHAVSSGGGLFGGWGGGTSSAAGGKKSGVSGSGPTSKTSRAEASGYR